MTSKYKQRVSTIIASLSLAASLTACSGGSTDKPEATPVSSMPETDDWKVQAELASESTLARGKKLFQMCTGCHGINEGEPSPAGPSLYGVAGRTVGSLELYPYTPTMKNSGETWTVKNFDEFVASPQTVLPGTGMAFTGIKNSEDRQALIAFIASKSLP